MNARPDLKKKSETNALMLQLNKQLLFFYF